MSAAAVVQPHVIVVFGATGDLMHRKILPALYNLYKRGVFGEGSVVLGAALPADLNDEAFRAKARESLPGVPDDFLQRLFYHSIGKGEPGDFNILAGRIAELEHDRNLPGNRMFYLALPPAAFPGTIASLGQAGLNHSAGSTRLVIEKPFGRDLASAKSLNKTLHEHFDESQVYRIDHYLGKETVQNLLMFRFANAMFESVWNRDKIERVEITVAETLGVEHRAAYYETAGALRDMIQNHLMQVLTAIAMELPGAFDAASIRYEKAKVLRSVQPIDMSDVVFGQYARGVVNGEVVPGYREEEGVAADSQTETFVALKLEIANMRWQGVPFYLHTGKRLERQLSQVAIRFRQPPSEIFQPHDVAVHGNDLIMQIQPEESFRLHFQVKVPGESVSLATQSLHFSYSEAFQPCPEAYETLLHDVLLGDQTLFVSDEWVETSWALYTPVLEHRPKVIPYTAGTWEPSGIERLSWPPRGL